MPEYEILEWNEDTLDIPALCRCNRFLKKCYDLKLWAFVSDYLRLYVLYKEGGIYLDTDVEVVKPFDSLLSNSFFMGYEENDYISTAVIGVEKGNTLIKRLLDFYEFEIWNVNFINNPIIFKYLFVKESSIFSECKIYPKKFFSPYTAGIKYCEQVETPETYCIHWYTKNWNISRRGYIFMHTKHIKNPFIKAIVILKKNIGYIRKKLIK